MVAEQFTLWQLLLGMLTFFICGYLVHWGKTKSKELEIKK